MFHKRSCRTHVSDAIRGDFSSHYRPSERRRVFPGEHAKQRRLAGRRAADQSEALAGPHAEREPVHCVVRSQLARLEVPLGDVFHDQHVLLCLRHFRQADYCMARIRNPSRSGCRDEGGCRGADLEHEKGAQVAQLAVVEAGDEIGVEEAVYCQPGEHRVDIRRIHPAWCTFLRNTYDGEAVSNKYVLVFSFKNGWYSLK